MSYIYIYLHVYLQSLRAHWTPSDDRQIKEGAVEMMSDRKEKGKIKIETFPNIISSSRLSSLFPALKLVDKNVALYVRQRPSYVITSTTTSQSQTQAVLPRRPSYMITSRTTSQSQTQAVLPRRPSYVITSTTTSQSQSQALLPRRPSYMITSTTTSQSQTQAVLPRRPSYITTSTTTSQ